MYEFTDKIIAYLIKRLTARFNKLRSVLQFDEINKVKSAVDDCYKECYTETRTRYREIGQHSYYSALLKYSDRSEKKALKDAEDTIDYLWIDKFLKEYDPITRYVFINEVDRKRARTFEGIVATKSEKEIKTSIRLWGGQVKQWADNVTDQATIKAYKDIGIKKVVWNTEEDARVCEICNERHGKVYDIDKIPAKPHIGCRCWLTPYKGKNEKRDNTTT